VTEVAAKRVADEVVLQFKVPTTNTDNTGPADLDRIEVYAHTGPLPATADFLKFGTLVQSIEIKQPVVEKPAAEGGERAEAPSGVRPDTPELAPEVEGTEAPAARSGSIEQGWATSVRERLTEKYFEIGPMPPARPVVLPEKPVQVETLETPGTVNFELPVARFYTIVGVSRSRHRRGPFAGPIRVPLAEPHQPPDTIETTYTETAISLRWPGRPEDAPVPVAPPAPAARPAAGEPAPPVTEPGPPPPAPAPEHAPAPSVAAEPHGDPNQETPGTYETYADVETEGTQDAPRPAVASTAKPQPPPTPRFGYNVYDAADVAALGAAPAEPEEPRRDKPGVLARVATPLAPLNARLLTSPVFEDPRIEFGTERCYVVRRVEMVGTIAVESAPSAPVCVTPADKFAPAAPKTLTSVASGTAVSLIWDVNTEADLGGYLVLRGEAPGDKLAPLTAEPITDASYVDTSVRRGRTYVYEVMAIDRTGNQSAPSNRVEEPIR
jgi:hypothetical protein